MTALGATAVQIVWSSQRGSRSIEHIGFAHDDAELEALKAAAGSRATGAPSRAGLAVTEREFDAPLLAAGFTDVHFLHGVFEFGKDFIAKGPKPPDGDTGTGNPALWVPHQFALQSKAGDLGEARLDGLAHPSFDLGLPHAGVLVTTGRQGHYLLFVWYYAISVLLLQRNPGPGTLA